MVDAVLLDIDGTLIDNNPLHVLAWQRALRRLNREVNGDEILHLLGLGGDKFAPAVLGKGASEQELEALRKYHEEEYIGRGLIEHSAPLPGALDLLNGLKARGVKVALASSASQAEVDHYLHDLDGGKAADAIVTKQDVVASKPSPDVFAAALEKLGRPASAAVVGDTIYDIEAAGKLGLPCVGVLSGGIERAELLGAGAAAVYDNAADVLRHLDDVLALEGAGGR